MRYIKEVFDVQTLPQAMNVVLTADPRRPNKFQHETDFLAQTISDNLEVTAETQILDFGCGMGRMSRAMIERFGCRVIGVDISDSMLKFAQLWVRNPRLFKAQHQLPDAESQDLALCVLVLQHAQNPQTEIDRIYECLRPGGHLVLVNENKRFVPSDVDKENFIIWHDDGVDIHALCRERFQEVQSVPYLDSGVDVIFFRKNPA